MIPELIVTDELQFLGMPAHLMGYVYLREAIVICIADPTKMYYITKGLYPDVAKKYKTTPSRVERACRHAIDVLFTRGNTDALNDIFEYATLNSSRSTPTNHEFISAIADKIRLEIKYKDDKDA
jgi:two-component system response regulator (stage 0 sporulation protein A)